MEASMEIMKLNQEELTKALCKIKNANKGTFVSGIAERAMHVGLIRLNLVELAILNTNLLK